MGHPVFQVTTAWGSSYMNMEKLADEVLSTRSDELESLEDQILSTTSMASDSNQYRPISLYYMDADDAIMAHAEFKQMESMDKADVRISSVSLGKALTSAANLGHGLLTGQPLSVTGRVLSTRDGGSLRHKIMPSKKQLYYAARCLGKERIGFFETSSSDSRIARKEAAVAAVLGNSALSLRCLNRRSAKRDRKTPYRPKNDVEAQNLHMDGYLGIPVFYAHGMVRRYPLWKSLVSGTRYEVPLFFNYEDLQSAWTKTKKTKTTTTTTDPTAAPDEPTIEVFNMWDVLTSIDRDNDRQRVARSGMPLPNQLVSVMSRPFRKRWAALQRPPSVIPDLNSVAFVPSSDATSYKETITSKGNGKARLRPMRKYK
jgi:hypothetical protein